MRLLFNKYTRNLYCVWLGRDGCTSPQFLKKVVYFFSRGGRGGRILHVRYYKTDAVVCICSCVAGSLQTPTRAGPVLHGGHVLLDVLRGVVPAHSSCGHVPHRVQGDAVPAYHRLGRTGVAGVHVRGPPDGYSRRNFTVSTFF